MRLTLQYFCSEDQNREGQKSIGGQEVWFNLHCYEIKGECQQEHFQFLNIDFHVQFNTHFFTLMPNLYDLISSAELKRYF